MYLHCYFQTIHAAFLQLFAGAINSGRPMGGCKFGKYPTHQCTETLQGKKFMFFKEKISKLSEIHYLEPGLYPSITDNVEAMNTFIQERHNHTESE